MISLVESKNVQLIETENGSYQELGAGNGEMLSKGHPLPVIR